MYCEQSSSATVIDSSDLDGEYEQQSSRTAAAVDVRNRVTSNEADDSNDDVNHNDSTPPRPKKSKGMHAGAALYKCKYNTIWAREFPFITPVPGDPYR